MGYACRKHFVNNEVNNHTIIYNTFFDTKNVTSPAILDIANNIKQQQEKMKFVQNFVQQDGYIRWDNALLVDKEGQDIALLPFVKQGASEITGYIQAQKLANNKGYTYEFFRTRNLSNYNYNNTSSRLNGKHANNIINYFNYSLFGKSNTTIPHKNVLPTYLQDQLGNGINLANIKRNVVSEQEYNTYNNNLSASSMRIEPVCNGRYVYYVYVNLAFEVMGIEKVCIAQEVVSVISTGNEPSNGGGSNNMPYWWLYGNNTGSGSWQGGIGGDPGVGGGGGGSGGTLGNSNCVYIPVGTNNNMQQPVTTIEPVNYYGGDPGGWQQCGNNQEPVYNPNIADNVIIDTTITNRFPCLVKIIDTISNFGNLNQQAQVALSQVFGVNQKIHLKLIIEDTLRGLAVSAKTNRKTDLLTQAQFDAGHFGALISINPDMLENATKEYITTTIVHEAMHAYIDYIYTEYNAGRVDSNYIKQHFPIFWGRIQRSPGEMLQHNNMALNWVQHISAPLYFFTNNEIDSLKKDEIYNALGWGGLENTDAFAARTDKCNILLINTIARNKNIIAPFNITLPDYPTCNGQYNFSATTLNLKKICD